MTRDELLAFFERRAEAWQRRDEKALAATHAEAGIVKSPIFTRVTSRAEIEQSYRTLFAAFPDWEMTLEAPLIDGDRAVVFFTAHATHKGDFMGLPGSGRRFEIEGVLYCRLENGLVAEERRVYDFTGLLIKLGVLRSKPATFG